MVKCPRCKRHMGRLMYYMNGIPSYVCLSCRNYFQEDKYHAV